MEGQGRNHYFDELLNSTTLPDHSMASDYGHLNAYYAAAIAANQRLSDPGYYAAAANNHRGFYDPQSEISSYQPVNNNFDTTSLESEFNRIRLSGPTLPQQPLNRRVRAPSAPSNLNLLYMDPNLYTNNLNGAGLSSYAYDYGRLAAASNLTNLNSILDYQNRSRVLDDYRSDYIYPIVKSRPASTNGLVGSQSSLRRPPIPTFSSLKELRGKIALAAKDQNGCRYLHNKFEEGNPEDTDLIFSEVKENICELVVDQFGTCLVQKIFMVCDDVQRTEMLSALLDDERKFQGVCTDTNGSKAVQELLKHMTTQEQRSRLVAVLRRLTMDLIKHSNGQHVIQECLKKFPYEDTKQILDVVADNCLDIAVDKSGCCVLQQCLLASEGESLERLIGNITSNAKNLSEHPYGNYVVQYIIGLKIRQVTSNVMAQLRGNFVSLSMSKYGSNVVEKFFKNAEGDEALPIVQELIDSPEFVRVLQDPFGNYVAQSALSSSRGPVHQAMSRLVNESYPFLHSHPHGKRVLARAKGYKMRS